MVGVTRRALSKDIDISTLYGMRASGMTNRQIAERVGCSLSTVYEYIGKRGRPESSTETKAAAPKPVTPQPERPAAEAEAPKEAVPAPDPVFVPVQENTPAVAPTMLKVLKEVRVLDLEGTLCNYHVNPLSGDVEFNSGVISGLLDKKSLQIFRRELDEIARLLGEAS